MIEHTPNRRSATCGVSPRGIAYVFAWGVALLATASAVAQQTPDEGVAWPEGVEPLSEAMLMEVAALGMDSLTFDEAVDHYDEYGYPEDRLGRLVLTRDDEGPLLTVRDDPVPYLLYAQFENRQRDAVFLARTGDHVDQMPNGDPFVVPYGFGAVKFSTISMSIVESLLIPHVSDARKHYEVFPLRDLYLGVGAGVTGLDLLARYVVRERIAAHVAVGINLFGGLRTGSILAAHWLPLRAGVGYRTPGPFRQLLGPTLVTFGGELLAGFFDRDNRPTTPVASVVPGAFVAVERVLLHEQPADRDFRADPRPSNYRASSVRLQASLYLNPWGGPVLSPAISLDTTINLLGPAIPEHQFKHTEVLFVHDIYRDDLREQAERREARAQRASDGE